MVRRTGYGAFFHPPMFVCESSNDTLGIMEGSNKRKIRCNFVFEDDFQVLVTDDGFVALLTERKDIALEYLNVLFSVFITKFHESRYITIEDLTLFAWNGPDSFLEIDLQSSPTLRNLFEIKRTSQGSFSDWQLIKRQEVDVHFMANMLSLAYDFYTNQETKTNLLLIGESSSLYFDRHFSASFLSSWLVIESLLENQWYEYIVSLKRSKEELDALKNHNSWTVSNFVEVFSFLGKIDSETRETLNKLRKIRNNIVHRTARKNNAVGTEEAHNCLSVAIDMVYNQLNQVNIFKDLKYKKSRTENNQKKKNIQVIFRKSSYDEGERVEAEIKGKELDDEGPIYFEVTDPKGNVIYHTDASVGTPREHSWMIDVYKIIKPNTFGKYTVKASTKFGPYHSASFTYVKK